MNGAAVNLWGQITNGQNVNFGGKIESAGGTAFVIKPTDSYGFFLLDVKAHAFHKVNRLQNPAANWIIASVAGDGGRYLFYTITAEISRVKLMRGE